MIEQRFGSIFDQVDLDVIIHQCNCFNTMGAGIAKHISVLYPEAVEADNRTKRGDRSKLGSYTTAKSERNGMIIVNMYSQYHYGTDKVQTDYDAMRKALLEIREDYESPFCQTVCGIPYGIGCGLAGGDWNIVEGILKDVFTNSKIKLVICKLK